jgi:SAM-dependent methyltransferase
MDLAGREFWDGFWRRQDGRRFTGLSHFQSCMSRLLFEFAKPGTTACEIGCGGSTWLPVLAGRGVDVSGIDYSNTGLDLTRANLARAGVSAHLILGDVRDPHSLSPGAFDVIFSAGFIEHFDDAAAVTRTVARALRPQGVIITLVPNFAGMWGRVQEWIDADLYRLHTIYTPASLDAMHAQAGLTPLRPARAFGGFGPLVVNYTRPLGGVPPALRTALVGGMWAIQQSAAWGLACVGARDRSSYSSHIAGVYQAR